MEKQSKAITPKLTEPLPSGESIIPIPVPIALQEALDMIVRLMIPEKIFLLDTYVNEQDGKDLYDLLLVMGTGSNRPYSEYATILEHISRSVHPVSATIVKRSDLFRKLKTGHIYFSRVCHPENLLYDDGRNPLPVPETIPVEDIIAKSEKDFHKGLNRARSFLKGAHYYSEKAEKELAVFMLHQATELTYRAILKGLTDHELLSHDLHSLGQRCRRCAPGIEYIFPGNNEHEKHLLHLLQKAYVNSRYRDSYEIDEDDLSILLYRVNHLHFIAESIFYYKIKEAAKALNQPGFPNTHFSSKNN